jgi:hypothetical protein
MDCLERILLMDSTQMDATQASALYLQLLGETAQISWSELEPLFARGVLLRVAGALDLVSVAEAVALDAKQEVAAWLASGLLERLQSEQAAAYVARDPELWAVVVSPWVLVQERGAGPGGDVE